MLRASPFICINCLYLRHITHQPDHFGLLLFSFQDLEHRLINARSLSLLQGYGTHCLLLYAQQPPFLHFDLNSKLTSLKLPFLLICIDSHLSCRTDIMDWSIELFMYGRHRMIFKHIRHDAIVNRSEVQ